MITADPTKRAHIVDEVQRIVAETAAADDRDLLRGFADVVLAELPDSVVFRLPAPAVAARLGEYFRFIAHTMPPEVQLYKGLPGLHVAVRHPDDAEDQAMAGHDGGLPGAGAVRRVGSARSSQRRCRQQQEHRRRRNGTTHRAPSM